MKKLTFLAVALIVIATSCKKDEKSPTPGTPGVTASGMTAWETSLVGQWKLKRTELRSNAFIFGYFDSTMFYTNHYNYNSSQLELGTTTWGATGVSPYYSGIMGLNDSDFPGAIPWSGGIGTINISGAPYFKVHYLTPDSMVLDLFGGQQRLFYNKLTAAPTLNAIESQLIGTWTLVSFDGSAPTNPHFKTFYNMWYCDDGYLSRDSIDNGTSSSVFIKSWEVLFPSRTTPIFHEALGGGLGYAKITNLTATSLTLEQIYPSISSATISTYIYSR